MSARVHFCAALFLAALLGCAAQPVASDERLQFPTYKFSVAKPPAGWIAVNLQIPGEFAAWSNAETKSRIGIQAHQPLPDGSVRAVVEAFKTSMSKGADDPPGVVRFTVKEEKEIDLGGKRFHRVILGTGTPADFIFYFLRGENFVFSLSLAVAPGHYDQDLAILERMARSVRA